MIVLIPLGGLGERFKKLGYKKPKPLINVMGKPIIFWLLDNLNLSSVQKIIIPYHHDLAKYNFEATIHKKYPKNNFQFLKLDKQTEGTAHTILLALNDIREDDSVLCVDGDNFYTTDIVSQWGNKNCVYYFHDDSESNAYSFIQTNQNEEITRIVEKSRISNQASCGAYGFQSLFELRKYCTISMEQNQRQNGEFYLSGVIQLMIENGLLFYGNPINKINHICLGTPFDVRIFCNNYPIVNVNGVCSIQRQRYCFDLDNTLVTYPRIAGDYTTVDPIPSTIEILKYLKKMGHTIVIYTARRMNTHHGNIGKVLADIGKITFDTLDKFQIPYDEIYFGKPYADFYIDDSAISPFDDLEKELGFYKSTIDTRQFNQLSSDVIHTYKKYGRDLSGEIYWYENMPSSLKDMFPLYIGVGDNYYIMERINGVPFSRLMLSEDLTLEHLKHIINSIHRIHQSPIPTTEMSKNINIYENYGPKLKDRYSNFDYCKFQNAEQTYQQIYHKLLEYEEKGFGKLSIIHGDTVLTNIMINQFGKIKFIDMRGKMGKQLTIVGDCFYDWGKLYQSLIGYDEILEDKQISFGYKKTLIQYFEERFIDDFGKEQLTYLKYLTASLLFTLIPLHNNNKCGQYYNLIFQLI